MRTATIYNFLLEANIMASLAILLMIPLRKFFRKRMGSTVFCFAWLLVAVRLLCPLALPNPLIHEIQSPYAPDPALRPIAGQVQVRISDAARDLYAWTENNHLESLTEPTFSLYKGMGNASVAILLMKVYLVGAGLVVAWFVLSNIRFRWKLRTGRIEPISGALLDRYNALCQARHVKPIPVYFTDPLPSACLVGVFKPYIALPLTASPTDAPQMLLHEICHYQGKDHLWAVLRLLCCAVHWFNPLVWLAAAMSRTDMELRCDERVTKNQTPEERKAYAGVLVLAAARRSSPGTPILATGMTMTGKKLKNRVLSIVGENRVIKGLAAAFAVLAAALLVCAFATLDPIRAVETVQAEDTNWWQVYEAPDLAEPILSDDAAVDYLKTKLDCFQTEIPENAQWNAEPVHPTTWRVWAVAPNGDILIECYLEQNGLIHNIYDSLPYAHHIAYIAADTPKQDASLTEEEKVQLIAFAQQSVARIYPGMAPTSEEAWHFGIVDQTEDCVYAVVTCPMTDEYPDQSLFYLIIQIAEGEPRLIYVECGPGNG